jgi:hypothetical protein
MNTRFKVFASYNILQYLCDFIHVLKFVTVSKCQKRNPKLRNVVILVFFPFWEINESGSLHCQKNLQGHQPKWLILYSFGGYEPISL